jgi:tRNA (Thr-GGU) A37 N-methylase
MESSAAWFRWQFEGLKVAALAWQDLVVPTLSMAADHGEFAFRSPHQPNGETAEDISLS